MPANRARVVSEAFRFTPKQKSVRSCCLGKNKAAEWGRLGIELGFEPHVPNMQHLTWLERNVCCFLQLAVLGAGTRPKKFRLSENGVFFCRCGGDGASCACVGGTPWPAQQQAPTRTAVVR